MSRLALALLAMAGTTSCIWTDDDGDANAEQIEWALNECNVRTRDYARDRALNGRYLIIYHEGEPAHERKMACVSDHLHALGVSATGIYPGPVNREGLY